MLLVGFLVGIHGLVLDDFIGGSAAAAGSLVKKLGGILVGYVFILELDFLKGREKLEAPVSTLLSRSTLYFPAKKTVRPKAE